MPLPPSSAEPALVISSMFACGAPRAVTELAFLCWSAAQRQIPGCAARWQQILLHAALLTAMPLMCYARIAHVCDEFADGFAARVFAVVRIDCVVSHPRTLSCNECLSQTATVFRLHSKSTRL